MPHREPFDPRRSLVAAREFRFAGLVYKPGDPFPGPDASDIALFSRRNIQRQYDTFAVNHAADAEAEADDLIKMTGPSGGRYKITAPWLEEPLIIRGKVNAEKALAEAREAGPPPGWGDGGDDKPADDDQAGSGDTETEGGDAGKDDNSANAGPQEGGEGGGNDDPGTDDAEKGDGADEAGKAETEADAEAEAGKSNDDPATA